MKLKEFPEIIIDTFPKLYERTTKVLITHLYKADEELCVPPTQFCKMYTTRILALQLICFLHKRQVNISMDNFVVVEVFKPFRLRLSDGTRLEAMLCQGSPLGNTHVLLIRREGHTKEPLLCCYSAVHQQEPHSLVRQKIFNDWISCGTERLFVNLQMASETWQPADFNKIAKKLENQPGRIAVMLPIFGYEYLIQQLAGRMRKRIALIDLTAELYKFLPADRSHLAADEQSCDVVLSNCLISVSVALKVLPLSDLDWSPAPTRDNLMLLCYLLRPNHINGIIVTKQLLVYPLPKYLHKYTAAFARKQKTAATSPQGEKKTQQSENVAISGVATDMQAEATIEETQQPVTSSKLAEIPKTQSSPKVQKHFRIIHHTTLKYMDESTENDSD